MTESATKTRISIIRACERLRRYYTSPICKWENDSLYKVDIRSLLEPITRRPARRSTKSSDISRKRKFTSPSERTTDDSSNMCSYWEAGRPCKFEPHCRYRHTCIACGKMDIHDPKVCKLRAVTSKLQRSWPLQSRGKTPHYHCWALYISELYGLPILFIPNLNYELNPLCVWWLTAYLNCIDDVSYIIRLRRIMVIVFVSNKQQFFFATLLRFMSHIWRVKDSHLVVCLLDSRFDDNLDDVICSSLP